MSRQVNWRCAGICQLYGSSTILFVNDTICQPTVIGMRGAVKKHFKVLQWISVGVGIILNWLHFKRVLVISCSNQINVFHHVWGDLLLDWRTRSWSGWTCRWTGRGRCTSPRHSSPSSGRTSTSRYTVLNQDKGSCNDNQTVMVEMSSSFIIFEMSTARISRKYAMESP